MQISNNNFGSIKISNQSNKPITNKDLNITETSFQEVIDKEINTPSEPKQKKIETGVQLSSNINTSAQTFNGVGNMIPTTTLPIIGGSNPEIVDNTENDVDDINNSRPENPVTSVDNTPNVELTGKVPAGVSPEIALAVQTSSAKYGVEEELVYAIIKAESGFDPNATSHAGAQGLMQLMPATAKSLGVTDPYNIQQNVDGGTKYISQMLDMFDGDMTLALAAYNAGPGNVRKYDGIPPFTETQNYVVKVEKFYNEFKAALA